MVATEHVTFTITPKLGVQAADRTPVYGYKTIDKGEEPKGKGKAIARTLESEPQPRSQDAPEPAKAKKAARPKNARKGKKASKEEKPVASSSQNLI